MPSCLPPAAAEREGLTRLVERLAGRAWVPKACSVSRCWPTIAPSVPWRGSPPRRASPATTKLARRTRRTRPCNHRMRTPPCDRPLRRAVAVAARAAAVARAGLAAVARRRAAAIAGRARAHRVGLVGRRAGCARLLHRARRRWHAGVGLSCAPAVGDNARRQRLVPARAIRVTARTRSQWQRLPSSHASRTPERETRHPRRARASARSQAVLPTRRAAAAISAANATLTTVPLMANTAPSAMNASSLVGRRGIDELRQERRGRTAPPSGSARWSRKPCAERAPPSDSGLGRRRRPAELRPLPRNSADAQPHQIWPRRPSATR